MNKIKNMHTKRELKEDNHIKYKKNHSAHKQGGTKKKRNKIEKILRIKKGKQHDDNHEQYKGTRSRYVRKTTQNKRH